MLHNIIYSLYIFIMFNFFFGGFMGAFSIWHWVIVLIVVLILFGGKGKLSGIMGDFGKGLKNFKDQVKSNKSSDRPKDSRSCGNRHIF